MLLWFLMSTILHVLQENDRLSRCNNWILLTEEDFNLYRNLEPIHAVSSLLFQACIHGIPFIASFLK